MILHQLGRNTTAKRLDAAAKPFLDAGAALANRLIDQTPDSQGQAALRTIIEDLQQGKPDSGRINADGYAALRQELERLSPPLAQFGSLQSVT